jgi:HEAT repeat protein
MLGFLCDIFSFHRERSEETAMALFGAPDVQALLDSGNIGALASALKYKKRLSDLEARYTRSNAAKALWQLGEKNMDSRLGARAAKALCSAMVDIDEAVRLPAVGALGSVGAQLRAGPIRRAVLGALLSALEDPRSADRRALAAQSLGRLTIAWAHKPLFDGMKYHLQSMVDGAGRTLSELSQLTFDPLQKAMGDSSTSVSAASTVSLGMLGDPRSVELLVAASKMGSPSLREAAIQGLGFMNDPRGIQRIAAMLRDDRKSVRATAVAALDSSSWQAARPSEEAAYAIASAKIGPIPLDDVSVGMLIADLDKEQAISSRAVSLLAAGDAAVAKSLADALPGIKGSAQDAAFSALTKIGAPAVDALISLLGAGQGPIRGKAARALGSIGEPRTAAPLASLLDDGEGDVRKTACNVLGVLGDRSFAETLFERIVDRAAEVREACAEALAKLGAPEWKALLMPSDYPKGGIEAWLCRLASSGDPRALDLVIEKSKDADGETRGGAAAAMGFSKDPRIPRILLGLLDDPASGVRGRAATALAKANAAIAVEPLIIALADESGSVGDAAAAALRELRDPRAIPAMESMLNGTSPASFKGSAGELMTALEALGWEPKGAAGAEYYISKRDWKACVAIGSDAVPPLLRQLDNDGGYVDESIKALELIGDGRAVEPLVALLSSPYHRHRKTAAEALVALYAKGDCLGAEWRKLILEQRTTIVQAHDDRKINHADEPEVSRPNDCDIPHSDSFDHIDRGIGVKFPM